MDWIGVIFGKIFIVDNILVTLIRYICLKFKIMKQVALFISIFLSSALMAQNEVKWTMTGALTPTSVSFRAKLTSNSGNIRARISTSNPQVAPFVYSSVGTADQSQNNLMAAMDAVGLQPNTKYYYAIEADGTVDDSADDIGTFTTPAVGPQSFSFITGSCNRYPDTKIYKDFLNYNSLFYLNLGDFHYDDPCDADPQYHRDGYEQKVFNQPNQTEVFRNLAFAYIWDDHDYCGNDANGDNFPGTPAARRAYQEYIPHYPLAAGSGNKAIYQSFDIGRVRFILSDVRSPRIQNTTAMGTAQKQWFKDQLIDARNKNLLVAWACSYSWYGVLDDNWGGEAAERTELSEFLRDSSIANMFIMNGDAHMFAIDNGTNGDFTTALDLPYEYPLMQAGPLDGTGSWKGGTYSEGQFYQFFTRASQYGLLEINDNGGDSICVTMKGYKKDLTTEATSELVSYSFCRKLGAYIAGVKNTLADNTKIDVYPNPSNGKFYFRSQETKSFKVSIQSIDGKVVFENTLPASSILPVDISNFSAGIYVARVEGANGGFSKKIVVNH
jgi:hypothetical protein